MTVKYHKHQNKIVKRRKPNTRPLKKKQRLVEVEDFSMIGNELKPPKMTKENSIECNTCWRPYHFIKLNGFFYVKKNYI